MSQVYYSSAPQSPEHLPERGGGGRRVLRPSAAIALLVAVAIMVALTINSVNGWGGLDGHAAVTLCVFVAAIWFWIFSTVEDTYVALGAAVALVISGTLPTERLFAALGEDSIWLLMAAFVIASAVASTGLAARGAAFIISGARSVRQLAHLSCLGLVVTAFAIPATSGRQRWCCPSS